MFLLALSFLNLMTPGLLAQFETATLTGAVSDPQGAMVAKATVKLTNVATNVEVSTVTDDDGRYTFNAVRPGTYQLSRRLPGSRSSSRAALCSR